MRFFTSEHHFGHNNIIKYCNRPFRNADEMKWRMTILCSTQHFLSVADIVLKGSFK